MKRSNTAFCLALVLAILLTLGLLGWLSLALLQQRQQTQLLPPDQGPAPDPQEQEFYSPQARWEYWRGFDATALAAAVTGVFPKADQAILAEGADENFLALNISPELRLHFSLRSANMTFHGPYQGYHRGFVFTSRRYDRVEAPRELARNYGAHLESLGCRVENSLETDTDGDGDTEFIYIVKDLVDTWLSGGDGSAEALAACQPLMGRRVCIFLDLPDGGLRVSSFLLPEGVEGITGALWDGGLLQLRHGGGIHREFLCEDALVATEYTREELLRLCARWRTCLESQGLTDVRLGLADVCQAPGAELLCTWYDGSDYVFRLCLPYEGRMATLLERRGSQGAIFLAQGPSGPCLLDYSQSVSGTDYSQSYRYRLISFDQAFELLTWQADAITVAADQGGGQAGAAFFSDFHALLQGAQVCLDPYALTGRTLMEGDMEELLSHSPSQGLHITNCVTGKVAVVQLQDANSWLNLRTGPSTDHPLLLLTPEDEDSCVKQLHGSLVSVILPHNTGDRANPLWLQIRITQDGRTLEGYSSQRFLKLEGIRRLTPGQEFTIQVDNRTEPLTWQSSDERIITIDETGTMTAHRSGMVLITVTSQTGQQDSCLVLVE